MDARTMSKVEEGRSPGGETASEAPRPRDGQSSDLTLVQFANVLLRYWRPVVFLPVLLAVVVGIHSLLQNRSYTASASFISQGVEDRQSGISELAARFGVEVGGRQDESPQFYADLLLSREILRDLAWTSYEFPTDTGTVTTTLIDLLGGQGTRDDRTRRAIVALERRLAISTSSATGVVEVSFPAGSPVLAEQVVGRLIELVNDFNLERRQSRAAEERRFVESRLEEARAELRDAEAALQSFLQQNRRFANSPELSFDFDRLSRRVEMRQQIVTQLATAYEQARIAEVRNTPVITLIERPEGSARPNPRGTVLKVLLTLILGTLAGMLVAFAREYLARTRARGTEDVEEFIALRDRMLREIRRPLRRLREKAGGGARTGSGGPS